MGKYAFYAFLVALAGWSAPTLAAELTVGGFGDLFNAAAGKSLQISKAACPKQPVPQCEYLGDHYKILVNGDDEAGAPDEIAIYIPRGSSASARKQAALKAATILAALSGVTAPGTAPKERGKLMTHLIDGAGRPPYRAETSLGSAQYVLTATDPVDFRIYVSWKD